MVCPDACLALTLWLSGQLCRAAQWYVQMLVQLSLLLGGVTFKVIVACSEALTLWPLEGRGDSCCIASECSFGLRYVPFCSSTNTNFHFNKILMELLLALALTTGMIKQGITDEAILLKRYVWFCLMSRSLISNLIRVTCSYFEAWGQLSKKFAPLLLSYPYRFFPFSFFLFLYRLILLKIYLSVVFW